MATTAATDDPLESDIQRLIELDRFRGEFANWRKRGREALKQFIVDSLKTDPQDVAAAKKKWQLPAPRRHQAQVIKALCHRGGDRRSIQPLLKLLRELQSADILGDPKKSALIEKHPDDDPLNLLDAAYALSALSSAPEAVLSPATMLLYYVVIRELYYPTPPVWIVGGARAGEGGRPSAFVTSQFVRAILAFARMLERTGEYFRTLAEIPQTRITDAEEWNVQDAKRRSLSLYTSLAKRSWNLALTLPDPVPSSLDGSDLRSFEAAARYDIFIALEQSKETFLAVQKAVHDYRNEERDAATTAAQKHLIDRSEGAHAVAFRALSNAIERSTMALEEFKVAPADRTTPLTEDERRAFATQLANLERQFKETATSVRKLTRPALDYLSNVLDTQLTLATADSGMIGFEPMEMAASAATLGSAGKEWNDERLLRAARYLTGAMGSDGFPISLPFHTAGGLSFYQPSQQHIIAAYAQILEHVDTDLSLVVLNRIARYFEKTREDIDSESSVWHWVHADARPLPRSAYQTAISTIAFDRLCRMLDRRINEIVLSHFNRKQPTLRQQDLFYPDYGLVTMLEQKDDSQRVPIAIALERMRAHVLSVPLKPPYAQRLYSVVFHGPPGTGKTTLLEGLAASAGVPFVEVTPSDIVVHGTDAVERRARAVLRALSFLTRAVVIFDEFDSVLQTREGSQAPQSMLTFLTPNMLPKLKTLYDAAKDREVAFALATNVLKKLDRAAIRSGRFDANIGVYPPDALSRYGRLYNEVQRYIDETDVAIPSELSERFAQAVKKSDGWSMQDVGRPGWFTRPKKKSAPEPGTLFGYLFLGGRFPQLPKLSEDRKKRASKKDAEDLWSDEEIEQWKLIEELEEEKGLGASIAKHAKEAKFTRGTAGAGAVPQSKQEAAR